MGGEKHRRGDSPPTFAASASAENWTRFRGPDGAGIASLGFSTAITEKNVAWKVALPGVGHSSPVTWDDHVYVTSADEAAARRYVLCLAATDGKVLWKSDEAFIPYHKHNDNSYASATPATDDLGVYVAWTMPHEYTLIALAHDGKSAGENPWAATKARTAAARRRSSLTTW